MPRLLGRLCVFIAVFLAAFSFLTKYKIIFSADYLDAPYYEEPETIQNFSYSSLAVEPRPVGRGDGEGTLVLTSTNLAELHVGTYATYNFEFTVGPNSIGANGGIFLILDSLYVQTDNPGAANYFIARHNGQEMVSSVIFYNNNLNCERQCSCLRTGDGPLNPTSTFSKRLVKINISSALNANEKIQIIYGDKSGGGAGAAVDRHAQYENIEGKENSLKFFTFVDGDGDCHASPINTTPTARIYPESASLIEAVLPSLVNVNESGKLTLKAKDQYGNLAISYRGTVSVSKDNTGVTIENLPPSYTFAEQDQGLHAFNVISKNTGLVRVLVQADGLSGGQSNPMVIVSNSSEKIYWGDSHVHTFQSDGRFSLYKLYNNAKKRASLDFAASSNHSGWLTPTEWTTINQVADAFNENGVFVTIPSYEFTCNTQNGGQRNIFFPSGNGPVYYCPLSTWPFMNANPYENVAGTLLNGGTNQLFSNPYLGSLLENNALTIAHHVSWDIAGQAWDYFNKDLDRVIEIYSEHGSGEYFNNPLHHKFQGTMTAQEGLAKGFRFGFIGASDDHHNTVPGGPRPPMIPFIPLTDCLSERVDIKLCYKGGLGAIYSSSLTRNGLFSAMKSRHTYATTGEKIFIEFNAETPERTYFMGDEFSSYSSPVFKGKVYGTNDLRRVEIVKGWEGNYNKDNPFPVVFSAPISAMVSEFSWQDPNFNQSAFYYLRVTQNPSADFPDRADMAWSSPIWVDKSATSNLNFRIKFQGISVQRPEKTVSVTLKQNGEEKYHLGALAINSDQYGIYSGTIGNIAPGTYDVFIKGWAHLQKKFSGINLNSGENIQNWSSTSLIAGDFNNNNKLNIIDISNLSSRYVSLSVPVDETNQIFDIDINSFININDISLVLTNYTELEKIGD